ncbi:3-hydroxyacyl-CoA dehydrogenase NAD-binding domain-containing protein, partial [Ideonella sp.]|uniref:3-hydroxyacyl-CoA dehydrogenase NAD-binding domain-containing protein n=1 Tax=Ideonella sp. TaxID=1929293 RepID=UPI003BB801C9
MSPSLKLNQIAPGASVLVVGAGIMGAGIAQVAAQAGHTVWLFDAREGAAEAAHAKLAATLDQLTAKGKLAPQQAAETLARIQPIRSLAAAAGATLAIEAIVEALQAKRELLQQLETVLGTEAILATNTSSISVTALGHGLQRPERLVGMHFFNPVPLMKLVEVVSGLCTDPEVAEVIFALAAAWGKVPVHARSTPGFIVNRIARPYYAEALALLQQRAAEPAVLDACLRSAGFRMGPCELMDLIGHDTNFAVTQSVFEANFFDKRYAPSLVQKAMVDAGLLGRKSGRGFYRHDGSALAAPVADSPQPLPFQAELTVHG